MVTNTNLPCGWVSRSESPITAGPSVYRSHDEEEVPVDGSLAHSCGLLFDLLRERCRSWPGHGWFVVRRACTGHIRIPEHIENDHQANDAECQPDENCDETLPGVHAFP